MKLTLISLFMLLSVLHGESDEDNQEKTEIIKSTEQHFEEGQKAFQKGDFSAALESFELSELESDHLDPIHFNRGLCHLALKDYDRAIEQFEKVLASQDPEYRLKAHYNLGHCHYEQAMQPPEPKEGEEPPPQEAGVMFNEEKLNLSVSAFREIESMARRYEGRLSGEALGIVEKAQNNIKIIIAKYTYYKDQLAKTKGRLTKVIRGNVSVNGQPARHAFVYIKSKWDDAIYAHMRTDESGKFNFEGLEVGKYELAAALFEEKNAEFLTWEQEVKVPSYETDETDLKIQGAMTLGMPYQSQTPSLETPWDDHLRFNGSKSITSSTDWGELNDGRPLESLPLDDDFHQGYVAFDALNLRIGMAIPTQQQPQAQPGQPAQEDTKETPPPTYQITLKGFQDLEDVHFPDTIRVFGLKEGQEQPIPLYSDNIQTESKGLTEWKSQEFIHQDCRQLLFDFSRSKGKRMSFHELEVAENLHQENDQQDQDQNQDQDPNQDQQQQQSDQNQQQNQPPEQQQPEQRESRSVRNILQKIKDKNEDAKERQKGSRIILHSDKDY